MGACAQLLSREEKASIDEAYLDLSLLTVQEILRRQPELATVPADAPLGLDTPLPAPPKIDWAQAGNVVPLDGQKRDEGGGEDAVKAEEEEEKIKESLEEEVDGWGDVALAIGAELMGKIRAEVRSKLGYTCSAVSLLQRRARERPYLKLSRRASHTTRRLPNYAPRGENRMLRPFSDKQPFLLF